MGSPLAINIWFLTEQIPGRLDIFGNSRVTLGIFFGKKQRLGQNIYRNTDLIRTIILETTRHSGESRARSEAFRRYQWGRAIGLDTGLHRFELRNFRS